jgi:hypothetical protein
MSFSWSQVSGPGTVTFLTATAEDTDVSVSVDGSYVLRLTVTDAAGNSAADELTLTWDATAPTVNAGSDLIAKTLTSLDATVTGATTYSWSKVSGPGAVTFGSASAEDSTVSADTDGAYVLRLTATDAAGNSAADELTLTWDTTAPTVNAGSDLTAKASASLDATVTGAATYSWSKVSGPGAVTFGSTNAEDTTVSADTDGAYVLRLTATDAAGNPAADELTLTWDTTAPTVNAGSDLLARASASLDASVTGAATYSWSKVSGPGAVTFGSASAEDSTVSADTDGVYVLRLTATDAAGNSAADELTLTWDTTAPTVNAGSDLLARASASLDATVTGAATYSWSKVSGPGAVTFGSTSAEDTTVSADTDGAYVLRLTATDAAGNSAADELTLTWDTTAPTVNAGSDLIAKASASLDATVTGAVTYSWSKVSGPGAVTFGSATAEDTTVSADADGAYVLRLTATDAAGNSAADELTLTWDTTAPTVNAGSDLLARASAILDATVTGAATYSWSKVSGPGAVTFGSASAEDSTVSADADGAYVLRLTATDAAGNSASDDLTLTWDTIAPTVSVGSDILTRQSVSINATTLDGATYSWSKVSGPGTITFLTPAAEDTDVTAGTDGTYVLRLTVADAAGNSAYDELTFTWDTTPPTVNVGDDLAIRAQTTLNGVTSGASSFSWSKTAGTGTISFGSATAASTTVTASVEGSYTLRLTATDAAGNSAYDELILEWDTTPPTVNVGTDLVAKSSVTINAAAVGATTYIWSKQSGSGTITFLTPNAEDTDVTASTDDTYVLRLTVSDNAGNSAYDELTLTWDTTAPTVNAGVDVTTKAMASLSATSSGASSWSWNQVSGPGSVSFGTANQEDTTASASLDGTYVLRLTATDAAGNSASDEMTFVWDTVPPTVNVGADLTVKQTVAIDAATSGASSFSWSKVSGPGTVSFGSAAAEDTTVAADAEGTYQIRLTATDAAGNSTSDDLSLVWDTTAPTATLSGAPTGTSSVLVLDITVAGTDVTQYRHAVVAGSSALCPTATYSDPRAVATKITDDISSLANGTITVCAVGLDAAGNQQSVTAATVASWTKAGGTLASPPTDLVATASNGSVALTWTSGAATSGFVVLRRPSAAITDAPVDLATYTAGQTIGSSTVVYAAAPASFTDNSVTNGVTYYYKVFAYDVNKRYTTGIATSAVPYSCSGPGGGPTAPTWQSATPGRGQNYLNWGVGGSSTVGYLVVRRTGVATCDPPVNGVDYTVNDTIGSSTVVYKGALEAFTDSGLTTNTNYYYQIFAYDNVYDYSVGVTVNATPKAFTLLATFSDVGTTGKDAGNINRTVIADARNPGSAKAYHLEGTEGVSIWDISTPLAAGSTLPLLGSFSTGFGDNYNMSQRDDYLFVGDFSYGLRILDITNSPTVTQVGFLSHRGAEGSVADGNYLYLATEEVVGGVQSGALLVVDISNKASPTLVGEVHVPGAAGYHVKKLGRYVYVTFNDTQVTPAATWWGLKVYDVSNPTTPTEVASFARGEAEGMRLVGPYLYISAEPYGGGQAKLEIFNLANPGAPTLVGTYNFAASTVAEVTFMGDYIFASNYSYGKVDVVDVLNKTAPSFVQAHTFKNMYPLYISDDGTRIFVTLQTKGFQWITVFQ